MTDFWTTDEIAVFLDDDAIWGGKVIKCDFRNDYYDANGVGTSSPGCECASSDVLNAKNEDPITINSIDYKIKNIQRNTDGFTILILSRD